MSLRNTHKAFTLMEAVAGVVIIALISTAAWIGVAVLMQSADTADRQTMAVNLMQKSQEELRRLAFTSFDTMETCQFPQEGEDPGGTDCGLQTIAPPFQGFTRLVEFSRESGSTELKKAVTLVSWRDWNGVERHIESVILLARPPSPLPGSVIGRVVDMETKEPIGSVKISLQFTGGDQLMYDSLSSAQLDERGHNYNFRDRISGLFVLVPGSWRLSANHAGYSPYVHTGLVQVDSNKETVVNFEMERLPEGGTITLRLINALTGIPIAFRNESQNKSYIQLYENGSKVSEKIGGGSLTREFSAAELGEEGKVFTVATDKAYQSGFVGQFNCTAGTTHYAPGWSSAIVREDASINCAFPRNGNVDSDRIALKPGEDVTIDIPLVPMPTATLTGMVTDDAGVPIANAKVYVRWPDWSLWYPYPQGVTNAQGVYSVTVPAAQAIFPDAAQYYLPVIVYGPVNTEGCCDTLGLTWQYNDGSWQYVGPFREGDTRTKDFKISRLKYDCGNANGTVRDDKTAGVISGVSVRIAGGNQATDIAGDYVYQCPPEKQDFFRVNVGSHQIDASRTGYYDYTTRGNSWYAANVPIVIQSTQQSVYDFRLWPKGVGKIHVIVEESSSGYAIDGVAVNLRVFYSQTGIKKVSGADGAGQAIFDNVAETWPPPGLLDRDPQRKYYNFAARQHVIEVTDPAGIYSSVSRVVTILEAGQTVTVVIRLDRLGGKM